MEVETAGILALIKAAAAIDFISNYCIYCHILIIKKKLVLFKNVLDETIKIVLLNLHP